MYQELNNLRLIELLNKIADGSRMMVFCDTKAKVDSLIKLLRLDGWHVATSIHGGKS